MVLWEGKPQLILPPHSTILQGRATFLQLKTLSYAIRDNDVSLSLYMLQRRLHFCLGQDRLLVNCQGHVIIRERETLGK